MVLKAGFTAKELDRMGSAAGLAADGRFTEAKRRLSEGEAAPAGGCDAAVGQTWGVDHDTLSEETLRRAREAQFSQQAALDRLTTFVDRMVGFHGREDGREDDGDDAGEMCEAGTLHSIYYVLTDSLSALNRIHRVLDELARI